MGISRGPWPVWGFWRMEGHRISLLSPGDQALGSDGEAEAAGKDTTEEEPEPR